MEIAKLCNSQHSAQPPTLSTKINANTLRTLIEENRFLTSQEMVVKLDCSKSMIENIMENPSMRCAASMWVS